MDIYVYNHAKIVFAMYIFNFLYIFVQVKTLYICTLDVAFRVLINYLFIFFVVIQNQQNLTIHTSSMKENETGQLTHCISPCLLEV